MSMLDDAIQAIRMGDKEEGRRLLEEMLETDEGNEDVWLWLTIVVDSDEDREVCLENVLAINPSNTIAQRNLNALKAGNFNPADIARSAIVEDEEEEAPATGATFLDEFRRAGEESDVEEDDELVMPSTMAKTKGKASKKAAKKKGGGFKLNPRLIILAVLVLLIICALGGMAAYNLFGGDLTGGEAGTEAPTPAGGGEPVQPSVEPPATQEQPVVPPTDTPQPTKPSSLELPTPKPTDLPTPTSTPVVMPTVS